jgi:RHS repeat-associated protein
MKPLTVTDPHGYVSSFKFDADGNRTCAIDANASAALQPKNTDGCSVSTQFDELNRPLLVRDALNGTTATTYDLLGHPLTQVDAEGRQYAWTYDGLGRPSTEIDFTGFVTKYALDQAGNAYQKTNRLTEITNTTFDVLNRPTNVSYLKDGSSEVMTYDPEGNLNYVGNANIAYSMIYDNLNRLTSKRDSRDRSLSFTWDKASHIQTKTTYQDTTASYTYDGAGTLVAISNPDYLTVNYQYDNAGRPLSRVMSSGARTLFAYDNGGWLQTLNQFDAAGTQVVSQSYTRDHVGNITGINVATGPAPGATTYTLDALYRLTVVNAPGTTSDEAFSYDHIGNRLTATRGGASIGATGSTTKYFIYTPATQTGSITGYTPTYDNRLSAIHIGSITGTLDSSFIFDNEGRLTGQSGSAPRTITWDAKGRLATLNHGTTETYLYDPMNFRIGRLGGVLGSLNYYLEGEHLESIEQNGVLTEKYFRGSTIDELVAGYVTQNSLLVPYLFHHDQVMSVSAETDPNGGTQASMAYWAFGETQATTGTPVNRLQYTGRENDGTGLYYYRARYYDPTIGRFISEDPKKFAAGINFFSYCNNSPIGCNDPSGEVALVDNLVGAGIGGVVDVSAQYTMAKLAGKPFDWNWKQTAVATGFGFATSGVSALLGDGVASFGYGAGASFALRTGGNTVIGATANVGQTATMNYMDGKSDSLGSAALWGGGFSFLGSVSADSITGISSAINQAKIDALSPGTQNFMANFADLNGFKFGGPSPAATTLGVQAGNLFGSLAAFNPGDSGASPASFSNQSGLSGGTFSGAAGGFLLYPNQANTNQMQSVYSKH